MKYTISAVKKTAIAKKDGTGTWSKVQVKTKETGDTIYELGNGHSKQFKDSVKSGDIVTGYISNDPWFKTDGSQGGVNSRLNGLTVEYLYSIILKLHPELDTELVNAPTATGKDEWAPEASPEDPGF